MDFIHLDFVEGSHSNPQDIAKDVLKLMNLMCIYIGLFMTSHHPVSNFAFKEHVSLLLHSYFQQAHSKLIDKTHK